MKKKILTLILATLISLTLATVSIPFGVSSEYIVYDSESNVCVVHPTGGDDTSNLREAFETVVAGGFGGEVELVEGVFTITEEIVVVGFDGWFHGAGKDKTTVENAYTETWPHRDVEHFPEVASLFLFYQTDNLTRTLRFSDMSIEVHGKTSEYPGGFTGMNCIDVVAYVNGDKNDIYTSEINVFLERVHFEGEPLDIWHAYNVINTFQASGEMMVVDDSWYFKPITGEYMVTNCTFNNVGGGPSIRSNNGDVTIRGNVLENVTFGMFVYDSGDYVDKGVTLIADNEISGSILHLIYLVDYENVIIEGNTLSGSMFGSGVYGWSSDYNYIEDNQISGCGGSGISLEESTKNIIIRNVLSDNTMDMSSDGYGVNFWMGNDYTSSDNVTHVDSIVEAMMEKETQLSEANEDITDLGIELQSANALIASLEGDLDEADTQTTNLESQLASAQSEIADLESRVASSLSYTMSIAIAVVLAIVAGAAGYLAAKRT